MAGSPEVVVARGAWSAGRRRVLKTAAGLRSKPSGRHFTMCSVLVGQRQFPIRFPRDGATPDPSAGPAERGASRPRRERCMGRGHPPSSTRRPPGSHPVVAEAADRRAGVNVAASGRQPPWPRGCLPRSVPVASRPCPSELSRALHREWSPLLGAGCKARTALVFSGEKLGCCPDTRLCCPGHGEGLGGTLSATDAPNAPVPSPVGLPAPARMPPGAACALTLPAAGGRAGACGPCTPHPHAGPAGSWHRLPRWRAAQHPVTWPGGAVPASPRRLTVGQSCTDEGALISKPEELGLRPQWAPRAYTCQGTGLQNQVGRRLHRRGVSRLPGVGPEFETYENPNHCPLIFRTGAPVCPHSERRNQKSKWN